MTYPEFVERYASLTYERMRSFLQVEVRWHDSAQPMVHWEWLSDLPVQSPITCSSMGYVVCLENHVLALAQSVTVPVDGPQVMGVLRIPGISILEIKRITDLENDDE